MMTKIKNITSGSIFLILIFFSNLFVLNAQSINGWYNAGVEFDLPKKLTLNTEVEVRNNFDYGIQIYQFFPEIGLGYKFNKHFDISSSYRYLQTREENKYFYSRHKFNMNISGDFSIERFTFKNRARYQIQSRQYIEDETDAIPDRYFRNKFEISYNINNNPSEPFLSFEVFYPLNSYMINTIDEYRVVAGIQFPVGKDQDMEIGVMYNTERFPAPEKTIAILCSYKFTVD